MDNNTDDATLIESMIKLLIVGASQVGKSALLTRFCSKTFSQTYSATQGVSFKYKMLEFISKKVKVQLWDVGGNDHADPLLKIYYKKAMGIVLVFSLDDHQSFEKLNVWLEYLKVHAHSNALVILVGTKSDLNKKVITTEEIQNFQQKFKIKMYFETSAKDDLNVNETFVELITEVKNKHDNGSFKVEENRLLTSSPLLKKAAAPLVSIDQIEAAKKKEELLKNNNAKILEQVKLAPVVEKKENQQNDKKIQDLIEATKQEISIEVEEIRKSVREEMELYFKEELNKVKRELNDQILQKADKSDVTQLQREKLERLKERYSDQEKVDNLKSDLSLLNKAFEGFSHNLTEEMIHTKAKAEKTLDSIVKENSSMEKRIAEIEKKCNTIMHSRGEHHIISDNLEIIHGNNNNFNRTIESSVNPSRLLESGRIWDEDDFKHEKDFLESSPTHLIIRESHLESQNGFHKRRHISIDANTTLTEGTYLHETMKRHEPRQSSGQGFEPQSMNIALGGEDEIVRNILELKNSMACLEDEIKDVQKRMPSVGGRKRQSRIMKRKRGSRMEVVGRADFEKNDSEISRIWETINTLIENTHSEIDRMKDEFKFVKKRQLSEGKYKKVQESIVEENLYGALGELRNDVHNQLIEVQKDLEESYGAFKTNVVDHHEVFFKRLYAEQGRFKKCIEEICMETIQEAVAKSQNKGEETGNGKVLERSSVVSEPLNNKDLSTSLSSEFDVTVERKYFKSFQVKITSMETQQRQMISCYSSSFQSLWENINMLTDKVNKLEEKDVFYSELGELGSFVNEGYNIDWKNKDI